MNKILKIALLLFFSTNIFAQVPTNQYFSKEVPLKDKEFQFFAFYINQAVTSNIYPYTYLQKGQVVGRLFGGNSTITSNEYTSAYVEQRLIPYFIYSPSLFNGKATLRASFELDWTWGDAGSGTGGNFGGGFSADQVNLQTKNLEIELNPVKDLYVNIGLQRIFDTPYNPYTTLFDKMATTGYRLAYFATDGVGISARKEWNSARIKTGYYKLYENYIQLDDDVTLFELSGEKDLNSNWKVGGSAYYLADRASGAGGVAGLGQGLNSLLAARTGASKFNFDNLPYKADIAWLGTFFSRNTEHRSDPWKVSGFLNFNIGTADTLTNQFLERAEWIRATKIFGYAANVRTSYRYGQRLNDNVSLDIIHSSGDANGLADGKYSGVITGNQWGAPGANFVSSGSYLLMPHGNVINQNTAAIFDISNMGYGMTAATLNASKEIIPNLLNAKIGGAAAMSTVKPFGGGYFVGTEANANVSYNFSPFMSLELHGAYLILGNFYDSRQSAYGSPVNGGSETRPVNPWTAFLVFKWFLF